MSEANCNEACNAERPSTENATVGAETGPSHARHQPWCSAAIPTGADRCPGCGIWQVANRGALQHGAYSRQARAGRVDARQRRVAEYIAQIARPTPVERVWARLFAEAEDIAADYTTYLDAQDGPVASRGRQRAAVAGRRQEVAQLLELGTKLQAAMRRSRGLPDAEDLEQSLEEYAGLAQGREGSRAD